MTMEKKYGKEKIADDVALNSKQKLTLILFAFTFEPLTVDSFALFSFDKVIYFCPFNAAVKTDEKATIAEKGV